MKPAKMLLLMIEILLDLICQNCRSCGGVVSIGSCRILSSDDPQTKRTSWFAFDSALQL